MDCGFYLFGPCPGRRLSPLLRLAGMLGHCCLPAKSHKQRQITAHIFDNPDPAGRDACGTQKKKRFSSTPSGQGLGGTTCTRYLYHAGGLPPGIRVIPLGSPPLRSRRFWGSPCGSGWYPGTSTCKMDRLCRSAKKRKSTQKKGKECSPPASSIALVTINQSSVAARWLMARASLSSALWLLSVIPTFLLLPHWCRVAVRRRPRRSVPLLHKKSTLAAAAFIGRLVFTENAAFALRNWVDGNFGPQEWFARGSWSANA